jgi:superfamily II DNA or RNA helicase
MPIVIESPTVARLVGYEGREEELRRLLRYHDKKVDFEIQKFKNSPYNLQRLGEEEFKARLDALKAERIKYLVFRDEQGLWTYSGLANKTALHFQDTIENKVEYPERESCPWHRVLDKEPRPYQQQAVERLIEGKHAGVEKGTGLGKSLDIMLLAKHHGLKTIIMAPSVSIAGQLYEDFLHYFGPKNVGKFYGGKKESQKRFVVAVAASLTRVEQGTKDWDNLSKAKVFIADESHLCPASTLLEVCFGLVRNAPYRYFFSATQIRNDGLDLVLEGITGPIVFRMSVREGIEQGYLAKPLFKLIRTKSASQYHSRDVNNMTRKHLLYNPAVNKAAGELANKAVDLLGHSVLILVDEIEQFSHLLPYLKHPAKFAHGGVTKENKGSLPPEYHDSDPAALVEEFNAGKLPILVGTSCISTGTDIRAVKTMIYLMGGKSEIQVKQAVGRCTRKVPGKDSCMVIDFDVVNIESQHRHAQTRKLIYDDIYGPVAEIDW